MSSKKMDWRNFFARHEEEHVKIIDYSGESSVPMEELYEAFKQRLLSEVRLGSQIENGKQDAS